MRKSILLLVLATCFNVLLAQQYQIPASIQWGEPYNEPRGSFLEKIITQNEEGFYALRRQLPNSFTRSEKVYIEKYDRNQKLKKSEKIDLKYKKKVRQFEDVIELGGELYMLSSFLNKGKKLNYLFAERITRSLRATEKLTKIGEIPVRNISRGGSFDYHISRDSSKILVYNELPYDRGNPEQFTFQVYDNRFNEIWKKDIVLPYNDEMFEVEEYQIDKEGNVYLLGVLYGEKNRLRRRGKPTYQYSILAYTNNGEDFQEYPIRLDDTFITDLTFRIANDGSLVCAGFFSERGTTSIKGTTFFRLDAKTKEIYNQNVKEFDFDFVSGDLSDRGKARALKAEREGKERKEAELFRYDLDKLIIRSDGGALLIAEQFYVEERNNFDPYYGGFNGVGVNRARQFDYLYNYHDIIVVNINPKGEIDWATRVPKRQVTQNDGGYFSSYSHCIVRDKIYLVYNDNRRNFDNDNERRRYNFSGRNSIITLSEISQDGSLKTYPLYENKDVNTITRPKVCKQTGRKEMTIYGERGRKFRFASLKFD